MTHKNIILGFVAIACIASYLSIGSVFAQPNGTPFLQEEIDAIEEIVLDLQDQLDNIQVPWTSVLDKPEGLVIVSSSCSTDQIIKWNGTHWECKDVQISTATIISSPGLDCNTILFMLEKPAQRDMDEGCFIQKAVFNLADISGADLSGATIDNASFDGGKAAGVNFSGAYIEDMDFYDADLSGAIFSGTVFSNVEFDMNNLSGADFTGADISGATFEEVFADPPCTGNPICATFPTTPP